MAGSARDRARTEFGFSGGFLPSAAPRPIDASSAIVSLELEREIGQQFLRQVRAQVPTARDPILEYYAELNLYRLAEHADVKRLPL